jgi:hypothetical protein
MAPLILLSLLNAGQARPEISDTRELVVRAAKRSWIRYGVNDGDQAARSHPISRVARPSRQTGGQRHLETIGAGLHAPEEMLF